MRREYGAAFSATTGSAVVAVAKAAHDVLVARFPGQQADATGLDAIYPAYITGLGLPAGAVARSPGRRVAMHIFKDILQPLGRKNK